MDEGELIARSQKGNVSAFNQLVLAHQELVYSVALRILSDPDGAADTTQEAFISAFQSVRSFRGGSFKVWLLRIVTNACYDALRSKKRRPTDSLDELAEADDYTGGPASTSFESPEDHALRVDMQAEVQRGLQLLPADQRVVVILADVHGLSYDEIAAVTKSELGTVKSRLNRGRTHLRDYLRARGVVPSTVSA